MELSIVREQEAIMRRKVGGAVGEQHNNEQSEERHQDENKRDVNERGIKKGKVVVLVTPRVVQRESLATNVLFVALPKE
jgi:hypothetical protein